LIIIIMKEHECKWVTVWEDQQKREGKGKNIKE
jgi:hypothetical protein